MDTENLLDDLEFLARIGMRRYLADESFTGEDAAMMGGLAFGMLSKYGGHDRSQALIDGVRADLETRGTLSTR